MHPFVNNGIKMMSQACRALNFQFDGTGSVRTITTEDGKHYIEAALQVEQQLFALIQKSYPEHQIFGPTRVHNSDSDVRWILTPLSGQVNYTNRIPHFACSIAIEVDNKIEHALVYDSLRDEFYSASSGRGTQFNGKRVRIRAEQPQGLYATNNPEYTRLTETDESENGEDNIQATPLPFRMTGCSVLDLAYVAANRLKGVILDNLDEFETAAGTLLVQEAGGFVTDYNGQPAEGLGGSIVAAEPKVHKSLLLAIR